ncbi:hypothetical protein FKM82_009894 [Ascaphus truei]
MFHSYNSRPFISTGPSYNTVFSSTCFKATCRSRPLIKSMISFQCQELLCNSTAFDFPHIRLWEGDLGSPYIQ